jgi:hypothetical protein
MFYKNNSIMRILIAVLRQTINYLRQKYVALNANRYIVLFLSTKHFDKSLDDIRDTLLYVY